MVKFAPFAEFMRLRLRTIPDKKLPPWQSRRFLGSAKPEYLECADELNAGRWTKAPVNFKQDTRGGNNSLPPPNKNDQQALQAARDNMTDVQSIQERERLAMTVKRYYRTNLLQNQRK